MDFLFQQSEKLVSKFEKHMGSNTGLSYMLIQVLLQSTTGLIIKLIPRIKSFQIVFYRSIIQQYLNYQSAAYYQIEVLPKDHNLFMLLQLRGVMGFMGMSLYFYGLTVISLAEAQSLLFTSSVWTGIMGSIILKEKYTIIEFSCAIFGLIGTILITKPSFLSSDQQQDLWLGRLSVICASVIQAGVFVLIRSIRKDANVFVINLYQNLNCVIFSPVGMMFQGSIFLNFREIILIIIMSVFAFLGMLMMTRGMMLEKPGKAAVINYLNIVLAIIYSSFILNEELDFLTILGSLSILSTAVLLFYKNWMIKEEL